MARVGEWLEGARLRTLPAAISPVLAGSAIAWHERAFNLLLAALALVVALAFQIGCNFANDYSDGIRGTDAQRVGPLRLVGSGLVKPKAVLAVALGCFGLAMVSGLAVVVVTAQWWLVLVGAACVLAAWFYTGGKHPYGYLGLGEIFVFVFFGLVAVGGTVFIQTGYLTWATLWASITIGLFATAILVANNLRDIPSDIEAGKLTLATRLGDKWTRLGYAFSVAVAVVGVGGIALSRHCRGLAAVAGIPLAAQPVLAVLRGATGFALVKVLKQTGLAEAVVALGLFAGMVIP
ncbi:MAG: 1,4-dihydroxy-2-naphthoate polyprenyltransferase [Propionibacteriaceae bacterium]|jgi:1,4-dihydroxy-2-naphthoate octaprenyltransferase|nr:1,4-dihydroxy-2-naphthoate polyprenyltransferase [Propionibacteriaceae bacterium]